MKLSWRRFFDLQWKTIYGVDGEHRTPYMTRVLIGRLRFHCFHRGDMDPDFHDHPWAFWTFPLTSYLEDVLHPDGILETHTVERFKFHYRPAEYRHRVLHAADQKFDEWGDIIGKPKKILTIVWRGKECRKWGFWKPTGEFMQYCFVKWRDYVYGEGKYAPCAD